MEFISMFIPLFSYEEKMERKDYTELNMNVKIESFCNWCDEDCKSESDKSTP